MEDALFAGAPPFDGIDAVFISHYHGDHFSPADVLRLLKAQPGEKSNLPKNNGQTFITGAEAAITHKFTGYLLIDNGITMVILLINENGHLHT